jgi:hypothetical protein
MIKRKKKINGNEKKLNRYNYLQLSIPYSIKQYIVDKRIQYKKKIGQELKSTCLQKNILKLYFSCLRQKKTPEPRMRFNSDESWKLKQHNINDDCADKNIWSRGNTLGNEQILVRQQALAIDNTIRN